MNGESGIADHYVSSATIRLILIVFFDVVSPTLRLGAGFSILSSAEVFLIGRQ